MDENTKFWLKNWSNDELRQRPTHQLKKVLLVGKELPG